MNMNEGLMMKDGTKEEEAAVKRPGVHGRGPRPGDGGNCRLRTAAERVS
jgi:hypothetical protein